ncbi:hypothetical protein BH10PSE1_BH10PSE1_02930 [soil metagenome]
MAIVQSVNRRVSFVVTAAVCLLVGACEKVADPPKPQVSSEDCGLAAKALERLMTPEEPHPWHLDFGPPRTSWKRDAFLPPALLEQSGTQQRYVWLEFGPEAPSLLPRFLRRRDLNPDGVKGPSVEMAQAFAAFHPTNAADCPEVRAYAASEGALPTRGASTLTSDGPNDLWLMVERPVISPDGKEAIVSLAARGSVGTLIFYRRQTDGSWREAAVVHSWIS